MRFHDIIGPAALGLTMVNGALSKPIVLGYLPFYKEVNLDAMDLGKYTHINMAFGIPKEDATIDFEGESKMPDVVKRVHDKGGKALVSLGGWGGSAHFSSILKDEKLRNTFLVNIVELVKKNNLDGIDIDWEYPGRIGNACNVFDKDNDSNNLKAFLATLRERLNAEFGEGTKLITMAVYVRPFDGPDGPLKDVSEFAKNVDYTALMQYDINGPWTSVSGPNTPLNFEKDKGVQESFASAIDEWTKAGWPADKLVAGFAFYGHSSQLLQDVDTNTANMYMSQTNQIPQGDKDDKPFADACAGTTTTSGTWSWRNLREQKVLDSSTTANEPWVRQVDEVSKTPWLVNKETKVFLSYDDPDSIKEKVLYAKSKGLAGVMIWSIEMDTDDQELTNAIVNNWPE